MLDFSLQDNIEKYPHSKMWWSPPLNRAFKFVSQTQPQKSSLKLTFSTK